MTGVVMDRELDRAPFIPNACKDVGLGDAIASLLRVSGKEPLDVLGQAEPWNTERWSPSEGR
jgi:hypothetical protein